MLRIVIIGGGSGISSILRGLKLFNEFDIYSISTPTDDGGSTGKILKIYDDIIPLGDIRNCIAALAEDPILQELLQYRFDRAEFYNHALGNLILLALYKLSNNDIVEFTNKIYHLFKIRGRVFLSTKKRGILVARMDNGYVVKGETLVNSYINENNCRIEEVYLEGIGDEDVNPLALDSLDIADVILVGPGSLFTSIIPNFLVKPILFHYNRSKAMKIYIANIVNQPNECISYHLSDYLKILSRYGLYFDYVLFNNGFISKELIERYLNKDSRYRIIVNDVSDSNVIEADLVDLKADLIRHDGLKVANLIKAILERVLS